MTNETVKKYWLNDEITIASAARDLYYRGLNVFPIPRRFEVAAQGSKYDPAQDKPPYILRPFFFQRMHLCSEKCIRLRAGRRCLPYTATFDALFDQANIACMMGRTSGNVFAFDCDSQQGFVSMREELDRRGFRYWAWRSSRGGGIMMRLKQGEILNMPKGAFYWPDVEVWGQRHYMVLPPSVHPMHGELYTWLIGPTRFSFPEGEPPPLISISDLEWAGLKLANDTNRCDLSNEGLSLPSWTEILSKNNRKLLSEQHLEGQRNLSLTPPAYEIAAYIKSGTISWEQGIEVLKLAASRALPPYPEHAIEAMLASAMRKKELSPARKFTEGHTILALKTFAKAFDWRVCKRFAQTDRLVFLACIDRAEVESVFKFRASVREIAEKANRQKDTASRALLRLSGRSSQIHTTPSFLIKLDERDPSGADVYRFSKSGWMSSRGDDVYETNIPLLMVS